MYPITKWYGYFLFFDGIYLNCTILSSTEQINTQRNVFLYPWFIFPFKYINGKEILLLLSLFFDVIFVESPSEYLVIWRKGNFDFQYALGETHYKVPVFFLHLKLAFIVLVDYFVSDNECPHSSVAGFLDIAPFHKRKNNWLWNVLWTRHL